MPGLQLHQLRVAAVSRVFASALSSKVDMHVATLIGLFHDMGNIVKAYLSVFPEFQEPLGTPYWQAVKEEYIARYGKNEHDATNAIAQDIGLPNLVIEHISNIKFSNTPRILESGPLELQIIKYADLRVGPHGVLSLEERLTEGKRRYGNKPFDSGDAYTETQYTLIADACSELERLLCDMSHIVPSDISDEVIAPVVEELRRYRIRE